MTEIQRYEHDRATLEYADPTGGRLVAWALAARAANQLAASLVKTTFVPKSFAGNENDATAAILMGDELGLSPLAALRSIYVVHGQPALYARSMVALAQSCGHEIWTEYSTADKVVVCGRRRGSEHMERAEWTMARAKQAGYTSNAKYNSNPQEMLYSKGAAEIARKVAADVLAGVPMSVEDLELEDGVEASTTTVSRGTTKARRNLEPVPTDEPPLDVVAEPDFDEPTTTEPADVPDDERMITPAQMRALHASLGEIGLGGAENRDAALDLMSRIIARNVESSKDLTCAEASTILDAIKTGEASA